ncbi:hypothetical protein [[Limnothrix rosea] IAM M-220]|uniref:hypothetical protein n=1 Tax=[Limnothrix rosea] IAM M-220 TaxID=454133 RepID=UPI0009592542|nr:hypothetical protein [[Limnothrix rosea] IAM M-220]OKH13818.1 hypothetical protein NIES208_14640 [[Limnothrix rosea] IAM M-220]
MSKSRDFVKEVQAALDDENLSCVESLLKKWQGFEPQDPWLQFYIARWFERTGREQDAAIRYRKLLRVSSSPKLMGSTRQALLALEEREQQRQAEAIAAQKAALGGEEYGLFVLEPIKKSAKKAAAQHFAKVMETDPYSAQMQLPLKSWRLFRTGQLGDLRFYANALQAGDIPGFCLSLEQLQTVQVFQVQFIKQLNPNLVVQCLDIAQQPVQISFEWSEIQQYVEGMIPLFEESLEKNARGKTYYKTKVLDYAHFLDLHVGDRLTILRLNDQHYQFKEGVSFFSESQMLQQIEQNSVRQSWNNLQTQLAQHLSHATKCDDFKSFATHAADFPELIRKIDAQTHLFRQEEHKETHWDPAWQLYSAIAFAKAAQEQAELSAETN